MKLRRRSLAISLLLLLITSASSVSFAGEERGDPVTVTVARPDSFEMPLPWGSDDEGSSSRSAPDGLDRALKAGDITRAQYALERALALFKPSEVGARYGFVRSAGGRDATASLLDLASRLDGLSSAQLETALSLFARPTDGDADPDGNGYDLDRTGVRYVCQPQADADGKVLKVCVHWAQKTADAPPNADSDGDGVPDQVELTLQVLSEVWNVEVLARGYDAPLPDRGKREGQGPNTGLDVYLVDIGRQGLLGYCTSDEEPSRALVRSHAYCVLDDDYSARQFGDELTSLEALQVGAAHEFFHAIQFGYEYSNKDRWLKEGTAVWMEDEVYDDINDLYVFLDESALHQPEISLDRFQSPTDGEDFEYGAWVFWRFLSEYFGTPDIIRDVWERTAPSAEIDPSALEALRVAAAGREPVNVVVPPGTDDPYRRAVAEFGFWNRFFLYEEGEAYLEALGTLPPNEAFFLLDEQRPGTGIRRLSMDHLTSGDILILVGETAAAEVSFGVNLPSYADGPEANFILFYEGGNAIWGSFILDGGGDAHDARFSAIGLQALQLILHNTDDSLEDAVYEYEITLVP